MKGIAVKIHVLLFSLSVFIPLSSQEQDSISNYSIDEVIISGKRIEMNPIDIGRSLSILTQEEINNSVYNNLGELLAHQGGINLIGNCQNPGALQRIYMRGTNSNQSLVLIDGIRITDPASVENTIDLSEVSLSNIQRIEIVRGSHSTYYGNSAIGGVINIYTRNRENPGLNVDAFMKTGTFGKNAYEFTQNLFLNYTLNNGLYFNGELFNSSINGLDAVIDTTASDTKFNIDNDDFQKRDIAGKIGYKNSRWDIYMSFKNINQITDLDDGAFRNDNNHNSELNRNMISYGLSYNISELINLNFFGGYTSIDRITTDDSSIVDQLEITEQTAIEIYDHQYVNNNYTGNVYNNEVQLSFTSKYLNAFIGGDIYKETMSADYYLYSNSQYGIFESEENLDTLNLYGLYKGLFAHIDIKGSNISKYLKNFSLALGGRFNNHSNYGNNYSYEINPLYKINNNSILYFSFATGFNSPSLYRLYYPSEYYASSISKGNPNMEPEISESWEFGVKQKIPGNTLLCISFFNTRIRNSIEYVYLWDKNIGIDTLGNDFMRDDHKGDTYLNLGTQNIRGVELSYSTKLGDKFAISGNITLFNGILEYDQSMIDTTHTSGHHVQLFNSGEFINNELKKSGLLRRSNTSNLTLSYRPAEILTLSTSIRYVGPTSDVYYDSNLGPWGALGMLNVDDYTLIDFNSRIRFQNNFTIYFKIENIFDVDYSEILGYTTKGRGLSLSLRYTY